MYHVKDIETNHHNTDTSTGNLIGEDGTVLYKNCTPMSGVKLIAEVLIKSKVNWDPSFLDVRSAHVNPIKVIGSSLMNLDP